MKSCMKSVFRTFSGGLSCMICMKSGYCLLSMGYGHFSYKSYTNHTQIIRSNSCMINTEIPIRVSVFQHGPNLVGISGNG